MTKRLVITEKPSVARDIAAALGGFTDEGEFLESEDLVVTWAVGHLLELSEPQDYDPGLKSWSIKKLPIIPPEYRIRPKEGQKKRVDEIEALGKRKDVVGIINACDAGREGELIYRRLVEFTGLDKKPQERLWLQSMTKDAIRTAFGHLRPGHELDALGDAAWLRSVGDWLVGLNATRALTQRLKSRGEVGAWSAGRVQTPTLKVLVDREREILAHVPRPYWELYGTFRHEAQTWDARYVVADQKPDEEDDPEARPGRIFDKAVLDALLAALSARPPGVASETRRKSQQSPPLLFDLTTLQREANRRFGFSAKRTSNAAQKLYETHKALTYPRTDSRHLPGDYEETVKGVIALLGGHPDHGVVAKKITKAGLLNGAKIFDSTKVSDHFAIVPTDQVPTGLTGDDAKIYELVVRQFLAAFMGPATWALVERLVQVEVAKVGPAIFRTSAKSLEVPGFLEALGQQAGAGTQLPALVAGQDKVSGLSCSVLSIREEAKETKARPRLTEAQLLRMMETAGELVDDEELSGAMSGRGLGTPATRADIIDRLVKTEYARRVESKLGPTPKAMRLIDVLDRVQVAALSSPRLTGEWESTLAQVALGKVKRSEMRERLESFTRDIVTSIAGFDHEKLYLGEPELGLCPNCGIGHVRESAWGYPCSRNDGKDAACNFMIWKDRYGRYVDRTLARRLLAERTVPKVIGFVDLSGREMSGSLTLELDPVSKKWVLRADFEGSPDKPAEDEVVLGERWPCPTYPGSVILETTHRYITKVFFEGKETSGPLLPKQVCRREMTPEEVAPYFGPAGRTELIAGFISKKGRPFKAMLVRKENGKHSFEFPASARDIARAIAAGEEPPTVAPDRGLRARPKAPAKAPKAPKEPKAPKAAKVPGERKATPKARKAAVPAPPPPPRQTIETKVRGKVRTATAPPPEPPKKAVRRAKAEVTEP